MTQVIEVLVGLPGSGKSTYSKSIVSARPGKVKRINKDMLREMLDSSHYTRANENFVLRMRDFAVSLAIRKDYELIIVDDTNFDIRHFNRMCDIAKHCNRNIIVTQKYFDIDLEECIRRDLQRPIGAGQVGEKVIRSFYNKYVKANKFVEQCKTFTRNKKFDQIFIPKSGYAIICDLDGTYATMGDRSPYNASACDKTDVVNQAINMTLKAHVKAYGAKILFVSGREDKDRESTIRFIDRHFVDDDGKILPYELFMRATKDDRDDTIVKMEIYEDKIFDKYDVLMAIDDRPRVIAAWRDLGLTVFAVNDVDF